MQLRALKKYWRHTDREAVCINVSEKYLQLVVYGEGEEKGVSFSYEEDLERILGEYYWLKRPKCFEDILSHILRILQKEAYNIAALDFIFVLEGCAYKEQLEMPRLGESELREALGWEIQQHIPWEEGSYTYRYAENIPTRVEAGVGTDMEAGQQLLEIYAVQDEYLKAIIDACRSMSLVLRGISVAEAFKNVCAGDDDLREIEFYEAFYGGEELEKKRVRYAAALRAAQQYFSGVHPFDFLSKRQRRETVLLRYAGALKAASLALLGISLIFAAATLTVSYIDKAEEEEVSARLAILKPWEQRRLELQRLKKDCNKLAQQVHILKGSRQLWSKYLLELGRIMPDGCRLFKIEQEEKQETREEKGNFVFSGEARDAESVRRLLQNLSVSSVFERAELLHTGATEQGKKLRLPSEIQFKFRMQLVDKRITEPKGGTADAEKSKKIPSNRETVEAI